MSNPLPKHNYLKKEIIMSKTIYHNHHIVPKHAGGTDDPENMVRLTTAEHAEAHRLLYEEHGRFQDKLAWQGLSGRIGKEEIIKELQSQPRSEETKQKMRGPKTEEHKAKLRGPRGEQANMRKPKSAEHKANMRGSKPEEAKANMRKPKSAEHRENIRLAKMGNDHGCKNRELSQTPQAIYLREWKAMRQRRNLP